MRLVLIIIFAFIIIVDTTGCLPYNKKNSLSNDKQITIQNGDRKLVFAAYPERLVTLRQHIAETALELDLDNKIVGASSVIDPPVLEHLKQRYAKLPVIAEIYPSPETLLAADPDIVWVDRKWAFVKNQLGSMNNIEKYGIKIYLSEAGFHDSSKIEYVYDDLRKMGKLFQKEKRADEVIKQMENKIEGVRQKINGVSSKVKVLDFDSGRNNLAFVGCRCMADKLINLAGGQNIFNDVDKEWASVNWEEIAKRNPDVIIVHEYRGVSGASKIAALKEKPLLQNINAVKNNRFVIINLDEVYEGVRNAETVEKFAKAFYPERFY